MSGTLSEEEKILSVYRYVVHGIEYPMFMGIPCDTHIRIDYLKQIPST